MQDFEEYLQEVRRRLMGEPAEREAVLSELRSHLFEKLSDLRAKDPETEEVVLVRRVLEDFGSPDDVAAAYNPAGSIVVAERKTGLVLTVDSRVAAAGARVVRGVRHAARDAQVAARRGYAWAEARAPRVSRAVREVARALGVALGLLFAWTFRFLAALVRGVGTTLRVLAVSFLVLLAIVLVAAVFAGVFLFDDIRAEVGSRMGNQVLYLSESCPSGCEGTIGPVAFYVSPAANRLTFDLQASRAADGGGSAAITVKDPAGEVVMMRSIDAAGPGTVRERHDWAPMPGDWSVAYTLDGYTGSLRTVANIRGVDI